MKRLPRWAKVLGGIVILLVIALVVVSLWIESIVAGEIEAALGGEASVGSVSGLFGSEVTLGDLSLVREGAGLARLGARQISLVFEGPVLGARGALKEVVIDGPSMTIDVERLDEGRSDATTPDPADTDEIDLDLVPETIRVNDGRVDVNLGGGWTLPLDRVDAVLERTDLRYSVTSFTGHVLGGSLSASGEVSLDALEKLKLQMRLSDVDVARLLAQAPFEAPMTRGALAAFVDVRHAEGSGLVGAGWINATQSHVWNLPVFSGVLDSLGLLASDADYLKELKARFHMEPDKLHFKELTAVGSPVSLYGHGWMTADGSQIEADFVPRIGRGLTKDLPVVGEPSQVLLDVVKGAAVEVQLRGSRDKLEVSTLPVPLITKPIQEFFDLVSGK